MSEIVNNLEKTLKSSPFDEEQKNLICKLISSFTVEQIYWLGGFLSGVNAAKLNSNGIATEISQKNNNESAINNQNKEKPQITIIYGSRTGNGEEIAENARRIALSKGFNPVLKDMSKMKPEDLTNEKNVLLIVSTHGDGVPPLEAEDLHHYLQNGHAPDLQGLKFSVCALGDSSYQRFCKTGKDFDNFLEKHGGTRIMSRVDCDVDYEDKSEQWINEALNSFAKITEVVQPASGNNLPDVPVTSKISYTKKKPFEATLINKVLLNGRGSEKETYHIELSLKDSGLKYEPGDSLGVYSINDEKLVNMITNCLQLNPYAKVDTYDGKIDLTDALTTKYELSVLNIEVLKKYAALSPNEKLEQLINDQHNVENYLYGRDILDLLIEFPVSGITANELISVLRKLPARLYSISSSNKLHPDEVHITVAAVRYKLNGRERYGVCSTFLADKVGSDTKISVYIEKNKAFRLPENNETPIIMIGPGTGIAPFRAFVEERSITGGYKNWLFFGDQHFTTDFLYQLEWQRFIKKKNLQKIDVAFSRDQTEKIYVQNRMLDNKKELYKWIQDGAHIYVCGDEKRMSKDVHSTFIEIIKSEGGITVEKAESFLKDLKKNKRYQEDVY